MILPPKRNTGPEPAPERRVLLKQLRENGPQRVYILWGEEDYLRDAFLQDLRKACVTEGTEAFNHHRLNGDPLDMNALRSAVEAMPFMSDRSLIEIQSFDISKTSTYEPAGLSAILKDVPDWATIAFVFPPDYTMDKRLTASKTLFSVGTSLYFTCVQQNKLAVWVQRHFAAEGKQIDPLTAGYLIEVCGMRMKTLLPEITKVAAYASGEAVTRKDIDAGARKSPEIKVFDMVDAIGDQRFDKAAALMGELLDDPDEAPQKMLSLIIDQFRRMYVVKMASECRKGDDYIFACLPEMKSRSFLIRRIKDSVRALSPGRITKALLLCTDCDFAMRDNGPEPEELLKELLIRLKMVFK